MDVDDADLQTALALSLGQPSPSPASSSNADIPSTESQQATTPQQPATVHEAELAKMIEIGFTEADSRRALKETNNTGAEAATVWLLAHLTNTSTSAPSNTSSKQPSVGNQINLLATLDEATAKLMSSRVKMVLCVRTDLKMGTGKIAAQCGHASVGLYRDLAFSRQSKKRECLQQWEDNACPKIALKVPSFEDMEQLEAKASALNLFTHIVLDAGKTQVAPGSATVLAIMGPELVVNQVTGGLKLL